MATTVSSKEILKQYWGFSDFRHRQAEIIDNAFNGDDLLVIMPTGGGKSICYQIPALMHEGICIVVSPLVALMKDQVEQLTNRSIKADAIFSGLTKTEIDHKLDNAVYGDTKFLYVSPERIETQIFQERVKKMKVNLVAIDEAHCISQWGYDFRPSYLNIVELRDLLPGIPFMALTASATPAVREDIIEKLDLKPKVFTSTFRRENISYISRKVENKSAKLIEALSKLAGSGIIYVRSRKKAAMVHQYLSENEISSTYYHAGLTGDERDLRQKQWMRNEIPIIVCTNAFGMGIDKPTVRFVIHWDIPDSLEAYYQEAGRAGRDGEMSYALLLYRSGDLSRLKSDIRRQFPAIAEVRQVYNALCNYMQVAMNSGYMMSFDFNLLQFVKTYKLDMMKAWHVISILEKEGYLMTSDNFGLPSRLKFLISKTDLYKFQVEYMKWDKHVQVLLRTYGGILDHYSQINEKYIADRLTMPMDQLMKDLKTLTRKGILNYIPFKNNPSITLLKNRLPDRSVIVDRDFWKTRRSVTEQQVETILNYCTSGEMCRQQIISEYFGETNTKACGKCDYCIEQRSPNLDEDEFSNIKSYLLDFLARQSSVKIEDIGREAGFYKKQNYTMAIRRLLDEGVLAIDANKQISITDPNDGKGNGIH